MKRTVMKSPMTSVTTKIEGFYRALGQLERWPDGAGVIIPRANVRNLQLDREVVDAVRSLLLGLSFGKFASVPHDRKTAKYYKKLSRYSAALAFVSDVSMLILGGKMKQYTQ